VACVGDQRFGAHVRQYMTAVSAGDLVAAAEHLSRVSARGVRADNLRQLNRDFLGLLLLRLNERVLALLFWFVVLGPMGAVLYRSVTQLHGAGMMAADRPSGGAESTGDCRGDGFREAGQRLKAIMDWLPARLAVLCYAVIGSFIDVLRSWRNKSRHPEGGWASVNDHLLLDAGIGALQLQGVYADGVDHRDDLDTESACEHVLAVRALSTRTLVAWVTILALMTLAGWLG